ncbi:MAG: DUF364 domain-containing protein [archaeon GB-1867-005]|nr:DUF364 domain-containing protein [Candidatus Culexmicrobium cathedralense]
MLIKHLREKWWKRVLNAGLEGEEVIVKASPLTPIEAIGNPTKWTFPLMTGREVMIEAVIGEAKGQAYTDKPSNFEGSLRDVKNLELNTNASRAIFIATVNATYRLLGLVEGTRHCKNDGPEKCASKIASWIYEKHGSARIGLIGYQPAILHHLALKFNHVRATDMNPENIGKNIDGQVVIEPHTNNYDVINWSDVILATGTIIVNNTIDKIIEAAKGKNLYFYGVTIAAAAKEFNLKRLCFESN